MQLGIDHGLQPLDPRAGGHQHPGLPEGLHRQLPGLAHQPPLGIGGPLQVQIGRHGLQGCLGRGQHPGLVGEAGLVGPIGKEQGKTEGLLGQGRLAGDRQVHHGHIRGTVRPHQGGIGGGHGGNPGGIGANRPQVLGAAGHLGQIAALIKLNRPAVALADHFPGQQATPIEVAPEGKGAAAGGTVEGGPMAAIEQGHPHLHHRLQQFGRVIRHHGDK